MSEEKRTYWGISIFQSRTAQFAALTFVIAILSVPEVLAIIPPRYMPLVLAIVAVINMCLRLFTVRPAAFVMPGQTKRVEVPKIGPPPPDESTD